MRRNYLNTFWVIATALLLLLNACNTGQVKHESGKYKDYAVKFANSEMKRFPEAWQLDHGTRYVWGYAQGLGCKAMLKVWKATEDPKYYNYVYQWADTMVNSDGSIQGYHVEKYNIDYINAGKILFDIYAQSGTEKFRMAMDTLLHQLDGHPKTSEGVFWHKKRYPHQIWLDGIYMAGPFMAEYGARFNRPGLIDQAIHEVLITAKRTHDPKTGLYFHAYDESREQKWADKETGHSPNLWGRAMGWYFMAMVDILDYVPEEHPQRKEVISVINDFAKAVKQCQDESGLWYQVVDQGGREKNYLEASVSSMFMYAVAKAVNKRYLPESYKSMALKTFDGLTNKLIKENEDGSLSLTQCCAVAGLGGHPYRDGSYEYYVNERIRDNDAKATGPFIMGCLELAKFKKW
jgi:unsaturated rhamnogalacturonyl hydrolase